MKNRKFCLGHVNRFEHLETALGGLEDEFDVGIKIGEEESDLYELDPSTGRRVWCEPRLVLHASVVHKDFPDDRKTVRYALTRAAYGTELSSVDDAIPMLLELALPALKSDLSLMKSGGQPDSATKIVMLRW
jgi:hypothetical protein